MKAEDYWFPIRSSYTNSERSGREKWKQTSAEFVIVGKIQFSNDSYVHVRFFTLWSLFSSLHQRGQQKHTQCACNRLLFSYTCWTCSLIVALTFKIENADFSLEWIFGGILADSLRRDRGKLLCVASKLDEIFRDKIRVCIKIIHTHAKFDWPNSIYRFQQSFCKTSECFVEKSSTFQFLKYSKLFEKKQVDMRKKNQSDKASLTLSSSKS